MIRPDFQEYLPSYYFSSVNPHTVYPKLQCRLKAETCIIGGGLSGLCTALPLAEHGHEAVVLEAARIGFGASGRSGGQVISDYACGMGKLKTGRLGAGAMVLATVFAGGRTGGRTRPQTCHRLRLAARLCHGCRPSAALGRVAAVA